MGLFDLSGLSNLAQLQEADKQDNDELPNIDEDSDVGMESMEIVDKTTDDHVLMALGRAERVRNLVNIVKRGESIFLEAYLYNFNDSDITTITGMISSLSEGDVVKLHIRDSRIAMLEGIALYNAVKDTAAHTVVSVSNIYSLYALLILIAADEKLVSTAISCQFSEPTFSTTAVTNVDANVVMKYVNESIDSYYNILISSGFMSADETAEHRNNNSLIAYYGDDFISRINRTGCNSEPTELVIPQNDTVRPATF
jgi:hypothetical protein